MAASSDKVASVRKPLTKTHHMGDRGNIVIKDGEDQVWLYSHWGGTELPEVLEESLALKERWGDPSYLARIILCKMIGEDRWNATSGIGIACRMGDNEHPILIVDCDVQCVRVINQSQLSKDRRLPDKLPVGVPFADFKAKTAIA